RGQGHDGLLPGGPGGSGEAAGSDQRVETAGESAFMAYKLYSHVQFCNQVRQGYMVVWINEVELERARQAAKAIEKVELAENPALDTDALGRRAKEAAKGSRGGDCSCGTVFSDLRAMSRVSPYKSEKP